MSNGHFMFMYLSVLWLPTIGTHKTLRRRKDKLKNTVQANNFNPPCAKTKGESEKCTPMCIFKAINDCFEKRLTHIGSFSSFVGIFLHIRAHAKIPFERFFFWVFALQLRK